ncbi:hypothetical protein HZB01_00920 [Candidatus Woesearchaeota archaeon]|nr:hypothetical protein [Candidatus Woesearchaeota archaeon]
MTKKNYISGNGGYIIPARMEKQVDGIDALLHPDFQALMSLQQQGRYGKLRVGVYEEGNPFYMTLQHGRDDACIYFTLKYAPKEEEPREKSFNGDFLRGYFRAATSDVRPELVISHYNEQKVKADGTFVRDQAHSPLHNGVSKHIAYWVPTIIRHVQKNGDSYLHALEFDGSPLFEKSRGNAYEFIPPEYSPSEETKAAIAGHYRSMHERTIQEIGDLRLTTIVTGTIVNLEKLTQEKLEGVLSVKAIEISEDHFLDTLLQKVKLVGLDVGGAKEAYYSGLRPTSPICR